MPPRYQEWLTHVFDHPILDPEWYFDPDIPQFVDSDDVVTDLITWTMSHCGTDLLKFSDSQVAQGLNYIFNGACSNYVFCIMDGKFGIDRKISAIRSIANVYTDCFSSRCSETVYLERNEARSRIDLTCYMFWDVTPLNYWEGRDGKNEAYAAVIEVMAAALRTGHIACIESALHGLGHTYTHAPDRAGAVVRRFIDANPKLNQKLLDYAECAAVGYVQ